MVRVFGRGARIFGGASGMVTLGVLAIAVAASVRCSDSSSAVRSDLADTYYLCFGEDRCGMAKGSPIAEIMAPPEIIERRFVCYVVAGEKALSFQANFGMIDQKTDVNVYVHSEPLDDVEAAALVGEMVELFKLERHGTVSQAKLDLEKWRRGERSGMGRTFSAGRKNGDTTIFVAIHQSFNDRRPHYISVTVTCP